jgi:hypothetical protein
MRPGPRARSTSERPAVSREYGSPFGCPTRNLRPRDGTTWNPHAVSNVAGQSAILLAGAAADCCSAGEPSRDHSALFSASEPQAPRVHRFVIGAARPSRSSCRARHKYQQFRQARRQRSGRTEFRKVRSSVPRTRIRRLLESVWIPAIKGVLGHLPVRPETRFRLRHLSGLIGNEDPTGFCDDMCELPSWWWWWRRFSSGRPARRCPSALRPWPSPGPGYRPRGRCPPSRSRARG